MALTRFSIDVDGMTIEGEGIVTVTGAPAEDPREAIIAFLDTVDAEHVEKLALERMGWGDALLTTQVLAILREALTGTPAGAPGV